MVSSPWLTTTPRRDQKSQAKTWDKKSTWQVTAVEDLQEQRFGYSLHAFVLCSLAYTSWSTHYLPQITKHRFITSWPKIHSLFPKADILTREDTALARISAHLRPLARTIGEENTEKANFSLTDWFVVTIRSCSGMRRISLSREGGQKEMNLSSLESSAVCHQLLQFITEMSYLELWDS